MSTEREGRENGERGMEGGREGGSETIWNPFRELRGIRVWFLRLLSKASITTSGI